MIFPVEKRMCDWCNRCCFYSDDSYGGPKCALNKEYFDERRKCWPFPIIPCLSNFTDDEMEELIDEYNKKEKL